MRVRACIVASTLDGARDSAFRLFEEFLGERHFEIVSEEARADYITICGEVLTWSCDFEAEVAE